MKTARIAAWLFAAALFVIVAPAGAAERPLLRSTPLGIPAPAINGAIGAGEWTGPAQIVFDDADAATQVKPTYVQFINDATDLYVLVDAVGDTTEDIGPAYVGDECLLVFGQGTTAYVAEVFGDGTTNECLPAGITVAVGFGPSAHAAADHRFYEWKVPLATIGAGPGQTVDFVSPLQFKFIPCTSRGPGSMPYDKSTGFDNVWPPGTTYLTREDHSEWGLLELAPVEGALFFTEGFSDGTAAGDGDWLALKGKWKTVLPDSGNRYLKSSNRDATGLIVADGLFFRDGRLSAEFRPGATAIDPVSGLPRPPTLALVFDMLDPARYRAVKVTRSAGGAWKLKLLQKGAYDGDPGGTKDAASLPAFNPRSWHLLAVEAWHSGITRVFMDGVQVAEGTFGGNSGGGVGLMTRYTTTKFDNVTAENATVLPPLD